MNIYISAYLPFSCAGIPLEPAHRRAFVGVSWGDDVWWGERALLAPALRLGWQLQWRIIPTKLLPMGESLLMGEIRTADKHYREHREGRRQEGERVENFRSQLMLCEKWCGWEYQGREECRVHMLICMKRCFSDWGRMGTQRGGLLRWPDQRLEWWRIQPLCRSVGRSIHREPTSPESWVRSSHMLCLNAFSG